MTRPDHADAPVVGGGAAGLPASTRLGRYSGRRSSYADHGIDIIDGLAAAFIGEPGAVAFGMLADFGAPALRT